MVRVVAKKKRKSRRDITRINVIRKGAPAGQLTRDPKTGLQVEARGRRPGSLAPGEKKKFSITDFKGTRTFETQAEFDAAKKQRLTGTVEEKEKFEIAKKIEERKEKEFQEGPKQSFPLEEKKGLLDTDISGTPLGAFGPEGTPGERLRTTIGIIPGGKGVQLAKTGLGKVIAKSGKAGGIEGAVTNILKTGKPKGLTAAEFAFRREVQAIRITKLAPQITNKAAIRMINTFNKFDKPKIVKLFSVKVPFLVKTGIGVGLFTATTVIGSDLIGVWWSLDNILDGQKFLIPDIEEAINLGEMTPQDARDLIKETDELAEMAKNFVIESSRKNPFLRPASKFLILGSELKTQAYEIKRDNFLAGIDGV